VVPDTAEYRNEAFSRAGNMFQTNLLSGLKSAGIPASLVLSCPPLPSFPRSAALVTRGGRAILPCDIPIVLLPLVNISPLKQIGLGLVVLCRLLRWGWKHRKAERRVVYTFNLSVPPGLFTLLAARLIGAKAVASVNDINVPGATVPRTWSTRLDYWLHKVLLPRFDALVPVSRAIIEDFAPSAAHVRVEGGILPELAAECGLKVTANSRDFCVIFAGSMEAVNGVEIVLEAITRLPGRHYRFIFAGSGPLAGAVEQAALGDSRIEYRGFLKLSELLSIYRQADVIINMRLTQALPSRYFFPSKLMEFLASGTPVISTCTGHVEEEFGKFVFLLKEETPDGLALAIRRAEATGARTRNKMGAKARAHMLEHKTWSAQAKRVGKLLESLAFAPAKGLN
jgi:glycosyltransferase involved in cell wall biosynthesis